MRDFSTKLYQLTQNWIENYVRGLQILDQTFDEGPLQTSHGTHQTIMLKNSIVQYPPSVSPTLTTGTYTSEESVER